MNDMTTVMEFCRQPFERDFFHALRRLQAACPGMPDIGTASRPKDEAMRFHQEPSLAFAPSTISGARWNEARRTLEISLRFTGLLGPNGPMPSHLTEYVMDRMRHGSDHTMEAFLNLFQHRFYALFFRAWALNQPTVDYDSPRRRRHPTYINSLFGLGTDGLANRDAVPDSARSFYAGWLCSHSRGGAGLASILRDFFQLPVRIQQFCGTWLELPAASRCRLGATPDTATLGTSCFAGERMWLANLKFRIRIGPLTLAQLKGFLPGETAWERVCGWVRFYVGLEQLWELQLVLRPTDVPRCILGGDARLGQTTWIGTPPGGTEIEDLVLQGAQ